MENGASDMETRTKTPDTKNEVLISVRNLKKHFPITRGVVRRQVGSIAAVDGISFDIRKGETLGLVGESGCGKSTAGRTILQLLEPTEGEVLWQGEDLTKIGKDELRLKRRHMQMIFQDPYASLNPRMTVGDLIEEPMIVQGIGDKKSRKERVRDLLVQVGLNEKFVTRYPHEFSGGQRQRICIARALSSNPSFIIGDEPISALDVSVQAQVVNLLDDLKKELGLTYLFIAHDLSMVRYISDRVAVMYLGRIVEIGGSNEVYDEPVHPYTRALINAIPEPTVDEEINEELLLEGDVPNPAAAPTGCNFHTRCPFATELCGQKEPDYFDIGADGSPHIIACHYAKDFAAELY